MKTIPPAAATQLARRSGCRVSLYGQWFYDRSESAAYTLSTDGRDLTGGYNADHLRIVSVSTETKLPYLGEGIFFPVLRITLDNSDARCNWMSDTAALYQKGLVGGDLCLSLAVWISDTCALTIPLAVRRAHALRAYDIPQTIELTGASQFARPIFLDVTQQYDVEAPGYCARQMLTGDASWPFDSADLSFPTFEAAEACHVAEGISLSYLFRPRDVKPPDERLVNSCRLAWHGGGSLYVNDLDQVCFYNWRYDPTATPDATWTAADLVAGSLELIPRLDRISTDTRVVGYNGYDDTDYTPVIIQTGTLLYDKRPKVLRWDFYDIADMTTPDWANVAAFLRLFQGVDLDTESVADVPTQLKCKVPLGEGAGLELGDTLAVTYAPLALTAAKFRIEEIRFDTKAWNFEVVAHNRMY